MHEQGRQNGFEFDFTLETQKLKQRVLSGSGTLCLDESSSPETPLQCCCGSVVLDSSNSGTHTCSGSLLDHWQNNKIVFPSRKAEERNYIGLLLPRARPSNCKALLSSLLKSRNKLHQQIGKSRLPPDFDVNKFPPKIGYSSKQTSSRLDSASSKTIKLTATKSQPSVVRKKTPISTPTWAHAAAVEGEEEDFRFIPEFFGRDGEILIQSARRGFTLFKEEFPGVLGGFDPAPGAGRHLKEESGSGSYWSQSHHPELGGGETTTMSPNEKEVVTKYWTPFDSVDILPRVMQAMRLEYGQKVELDHGEQEAKIGLRQNSSVVQKWEEYEKTFQAAETNSNICSNCWNKLARNVGVGTQSDDEENSNVEGPEMETTPSLVKGALLPTPVYKPEKDAYVNRQIIQPLFSLPLPIPPTLPTSKNWSTYSSHFGRSNKSPSNSKTVVPVLQPSFVSYDSFPPLSTAITGEKESPQCSTSNFTSSPPIPVVNKPRIPSLMDLNITLPSSSPSTSNAALVKRKGLPRLPTIADAIQHSIMKPLRRSYTTVVKSSQNTNLCKIQKLSGAAAAELRAICLRRTDAAVTSTLTEISGQTSPRVPSSADISNHRNGELYSSVTSLSSHRPLASNMPLNGNPSPLSSPQITPRFQSLPVVDSKTPKILKISDGKENPRESQKQAKKTLLHSLVASQPQPQVRHLEVLQRVDFDTFIQDWMKTKSSMVYLDSTGKAEFKRISLIHQK